MSEPMGTGPWWVPSSSHGKAKFVTRSNALLMAGIAGLVGAVFGASSSGSLFGHEIKLSSVKKVGKMITPSIEEIKLKMA